MNVAQLTLTPIHRWVIVAILFVTPALFLAGVTNYYFFAGSWLPYMSIASLLLPLYLLFFELPHIIASYLGFFDREYVRFYSRSLFIWLPLVLSGFGLLLWWHMTAAIVLYLVATMYHVMRQQTGIALMFGVKKDKWHAMWSWLAVGITAVMYLTIAVPDIVGETYIQFAYTLTIGFLLLLASLSFYLVSRTPGRLARIYILMLPVLLIQSYILLTIGYLFLAIFMIRFVHDVTAFLFYIAHDVNRNRVAVQNWLYKFVPFIPKALYVVVPAFGVGLGLAMRETITNTEAIFIISMFLAMIHYFLESVMWKRESLHRRYVKVV
jgi:hypothetical protein